MKYEEFPVSTVPKESEADGEQRIRWVQIAIGVTAAALLTICGWYAGHTSGSVEHEHLITQVAQSERALSSSRLEAQQQQRQAERVNAALSASGKSNAVNEVMSLQDRVRRLDAEVEVIRPERPEGFLDYALLPRRRHG